MCAKKTKRKFGPPVNWPDLLSGSDFCDNYRVEHWRDDFEGFPPSRFVHSRSPFAGVVSFRYPPSMAFDGRLTVALCPS